MIKGKELLRLIDAIHKDKKIDKEEVFSVIEDALLSVVQKKYKSGPDIDLKIERDTGNIIIFDGDKELSPEDLGRIVAQSAKQVILQKIREAEKNVIYREYTAKEGTIVSGTVQRMERGTLVINLGNTIGYMPRKEQIPEETFKPGDRIRALILKVYKEGGEVKVILSRSNKRFILEFFKLEVPEIGEGIIEIKGIVREPGYRTKILVHSKDSKVDSLGACVGVRGARIKNILNELQKEKIDIIPWTDKVEDLIVRAMNPAEVEEMELDPVNKYVKIFVSKDQLSQAIGRRGANVKLACEITGYQIDVEAIKEENNEKENS